MIRPPREGLSLRRRLLPRRDRDAILHRQHDDGGQLVRAQATVKPQFGAMRGEITWKKDWDKALTSKEAEAFWEGRW